MRDVQFIAGARHADFDEPGARAATGMLPAGLDRRQRAMRVRRSSVRSGEGGAQRRDMQPVAQRRPARRRSRAAARSTSARSPTGSLTLDELHAGTGAIGNVGGWWLDEVWDFIRLLPEQLTADIARAHRARRPRQSARRRTARSSAITRSSSHAPLAQRADASSSRTSCSTRAPDRSSSAPGSHVRAFTRLAGPVLHRPRRPGPGRRHLGVLDRRRVQGSR